MKLKKINFSKKENLTRKDYPKPVTNSQKKITDLLKKISKKKLT